MDNYLKLSDEDDDISEATTKIIGEAKTSVVALSSANSMLGSSSAARGVSQFSINVYLGLIDVSKPDNLNKVWDASTGNPFAELNQIDLNETLEEKQKRYGQFQNQDFSCYIWNIAKTPIIIIVAAWIIGITFKYIKVKIKILKMLKQKLIWKLPIMFFFMSNLCIGIFSLANLNYKTISSVNGKINFAIAGLIQIFYIIFYLFILKVMIMAVNAHNNNYDMEICSPLFPISHCWLRKIKIKLMNFSVLFDDYHLDFFQRSIYSLLELMKYQGFSLIIVFLYQYPNLQLILLYAIGIMTLIFQILMQAYSQMKMYAITVVNGVFFILESFAFYAICITDPNKPDDVYANGSMLVFLLLTQNCCDIIINCYSLKLDLVNFLNTQQSSSFAKIEEQISKQCTQIEESLHYFSEELIEIEETLCINFDDSNEIWFE